MGLLHQRKLIRDAVAAELLGATAAGVRVQNNRVFAWPTKLTDLGPCISIYALVDPVEAASKTSAPRKLTHKLQLAIEGVIAVDPGAQSPDDALDALAKQIEKAMHADPTFGGVCSDSLLSTTDIEVSGEGKNLVGNIRLLYEVQYITDAPDREDVALDDFRTAHVNLDLGGEQDEDDQVTTTTELPWEIYVDAAPARPVEHDVPQVAIFSLAELLELGAQLWLNGAASTETGLETGQHAFELEHVATAAVVASSPMGGITPVDGRVLDVVDDTVIAALEAAGPYGPFILTLLDPNGDALDTMHITLNP